jgi:hypothetical protein
VMNRPDAAKCTEKFSVSVREGLIFVELPVAPMAIERNAAACANVNSARCCLDSGAMADGVA